VSYEESGAFVYVGDVMQQNGITANDFTSPVVYSLSGSYQKDWIVTVSLTSGIKESDFLKVRIWPNPSSGSFEISNIKGFDIVIWNSLGVKLLREFNYISKSTVQIKGLKSGLYFVKLRKDGFVQTRKLIVK